VSEANLSTGRGQPRSCIFCGARPTTREHVWPDWLRRRVANEETMQHTAMLELGGEVTELFSYDDKPYKATANVVCAGCNNGWMSRTEEAAKPYLAGMVEERGRELHEGGQLVLARWALLKAIIFDHAAPRQARSANSALLYPLCVGGGPPLTGCRIWMAAYGGELPGFTALTALAVGTDEDLYTGERNVWVRTFSVGPVVFQVFSTMTVALAGHDPGWQTLADPPQVLQIWPAEGSSRWHPFPAFNDRGLTWFANHVIASLIRSSEDHWP
jgi:hypothetical protein